MHATSAHRSWLKHGVWVEKERGPPQQYSIVDPPPPLRRGSTTHFAKVRLSLLFSSLSCVHSQSPGCGALVL